MLSMDEMKQNSTAWYRWRGKGLGASDAPAVMGISPWKTRFQLWAEKCGKLQPTPAHPMAVAAMERGKFLESFAREWYEKKTGLLMPASNHEHAQYTFIRASLDGRNVQARKIIEIKSPGKVDHAKAVKGEVPKKYYAQIQQQLLVTGDPICDYVSFDGKDGVIIPVHEDKAYQATLLKELIAFWKLVETQTPPSVDASDLDKLMKDFNKQLDVLNQYRDALNLLNESLLTASLAA